MELCGHDSDMELMDLRIVDLSDGICEAGNAHYVYRRRSKV